MVKPKRRRPFEASATQASEPLERYVDQSSAIFGFFKDQSVRETVESILIAVLVALLFRAYQVEAFIIPTGSMAPALQGEHMDVVCKECGNQYRAGAPLDTTVNKTHCPICKFGMPMQVRNPDHFSNDGDRIIVNKFIYDFQEPERFDVIVFKNPNNGKQNYIKRLIGLPGEQLLLENGDIFKFVPDESGNPQKTIVRKPINKVDVMLQLVDDTHFRSTQMREIGWPNRWSEWSAPNTNWRDNESEGHPYFTNDGSGQNQKLNWLRYRHLAPRSSHDEQTYALHRRQRTIGASERPTEWDYISERKKIPVRIKDRNDQISAGALIRDYYEYNDRRFRLENSLPADLRMERNMQMVSPAAHWVGDLAFETDLEIKSDSGTLALDLVEGGVHFQCLIDIDTGIATLQTKGDNGNIVFDSPDKKAPSAQTSLKGKGTYNILYIHIDDMVYLRIDNQYVKFDGASYTKKSNARPVPKYSKIDPGDAEPLGLGASNAVVQVNRLKVFRDVYYVSPDQIIPIGDDRTRANIRNETGASMYDLLRIYEQPEQWQTALAKKIFERPQHTEPMFRLPEDGYFPMGDNSPASQDARVWLGPTFVKDEMMIGRAMFIYWPHSLNKPIKYFPNFKRMGFIR